MLPWPPKMATGQDFVKKAMDKFIGAGGGRECPPPRMARSP